MKSIGKYSPLVVAVIFGLIFQGIFIKADKTDTPHKAAYKFAKGYYLLDKDAMIEQLCKAGISNDAVGDYLFYIEKTAAGRGFDLKYMKSHLYKTHLSLIENTGEKASIKITGKRRTAINPVFEIVAVLFGFGHPQDVDGLIELIKENDQWKVCGETFELMS